MRYIYITTNEINGKRYIGQRKCPKGKTPTKDTYLGSGNLLLKAIKKYGKENFTKEVLFYGLNQEEADILEIYEIKLRDVLNKKDMWYNLDAGGQYNRAEEHSEITSKAMKAFYADEGNYSDWIKRTNIARLSKGMKELNYSSRKEKEEYEDMLAKKAKMRYIAKKMRENINRCIKSFVKSTPEYIERAKVIQQHKVKKASKASWVNKEEKLKLLAKGRRDRGDRLGDKYWSTDMKRKFGLAKCRSANNLLGEYILINYDMNYSNVGCKIKKAVKGNYKDEANRVMQLEKIRVIIIKESGKDICLNKMIELTHSSRLVAV